MVKGITRRVIVVRHPDRRLFEQAIFILREDLPGRTGVTEDQVLAEARQAADGYVRRAALRSPTLRGRLLLGLFLGAISASALWAVLLVLLF